MIAQIIIGSLVLLPASNDPILSEAVAQETQAVTAIVDFSFNPRDTAATAWQIRLDSEGRGTYKAEPNSPLMPITVSAITLQTLLSTEPVVRAGLCGTKLKHIASTGMKTIRFNDALQSSCTFDYSDSTQLMAASSIFQAIAETIQIGQHLEREEHFDRLSVDADMDRLVEESKDGRALELQNIAPTLKSLVDNERIMERARRKAARLLQDMIHESPSRP